MKARKEEKTRLVEGESESEGDEDEHEAQEDSGCGEVAEERCVLVFEDPVVVVGTAYRRQRGQDEKEERKGD